MLEHLLRLCAISCLLVTPTRVEAAVRPPPVVSDSAAAAARSPEAASHERVETTASVPRGNGVGGTAEQTTRPVATETDVSGEPRRKLGIVARAALGVLDLGSGDVQRNPATPAVALPTSMAAGVAGAFMLNASGARRTMWGVAVGYESSHGLTAVLLDSVGPAVVRPARWHRLEASLRSFRRVGALERGEVGTEFGYSRVAFTSPVRLPTDESKLQGPRAAIAVAAWLLSERVRLAVTPQVAFLWRTGPAASAVSSTGTPPDSGGAGASPGSGSGPILEPGGAAVVVVVIGRGFGLGAEYRRLHALSRRPAAERGPVQWSRTVLLSLTFDSVFLR
ncbi:MAG: hypothetical protein V3V08_09455 [Nannocystaceae bacterium]